MKKLLFKITSFVLIAFYIFSPVSTWAQSVQSAAQRLQQQRLQDQQQCLERPKSQNSATTDGTISNLLANAFKENLSRGINDFFSNELGPLVQKKIDKVMPTLIQNGLARRLPSYVEDATYRRHGNNAPSVEELRAITEEGIKIITADVIREETPNITDYVLSHDFPQYIEDSFSTTTSDVITSPEFVQKVREAVDVMDAQLRLAQVDASLNLVKYAKTMLDSLKYEGQAAMEALRNGDVTAPLNQIRDLVEQGKQLQKMAEDIKKMALTQEQKDLMVNTIIEEMAATGKEAVKNDSSILELVDSISSRVSSAVDMTVTDSFVADIGNLTSRDDYHDAISDNLNDGTLSAGGIDFTGPNGDLTGGLAGEIFNPMVTDMAGPIAQFTYGFTNGLVSSGSFSFASAVGNNPGATMMVQGVTGSGSSGWAPVSSLDLPGSSLNPSDVRILNSSTGRWETPASGDFVGPPSADAIQTPPALNGEGPLLNTSAENVGDVVATQGATNAAAKISASEVFKGMGTAFIGAVPGMVGGMVGALCSNIPVVGGLIAPIASLATTYALIALLGLSPKPLGWLVTDIGMQINVGMGFDAMGKAIGEVIKNTGKSNANEEQANKYLASVQATNLQACTYEKSTNRIALFLEELFGIRITDSIKANYRASSQLLNGPVRKMLAQGYNVVDPSVPGSSSGKNGQTMINNLPRTIAQNKKEAAQIVTEQMRERDNWAEAKAADKLDRINANISNGSPVSEETYTKMQSPQTQMDSEVWWGNKLALANPNNRINPNTAFVEGMSDQINAVSNSEQKTRDDHTAYGGILPSRVCKTMAGDVCVEWEILTPGSIIGNFANRALTNIFDFFTVAANNADFIIRQIATQGLPTNVAQSPETGSSDQNASDVNSYCQGPGPCTDADRKLPTKRIENDAENQVENSSFNANSPDSLYGDDNSDSDLEDIEWPDLSSLQ